MLLYLRLLQHVAQLSPHNVHNNAIFALHNLQDNPILEKQLPDISITYSLKFLKLASASCKVQHNLSPVQLF